MINSYDMLALQELKVWQHRMLRKPSLLNNLSKKMQTKVNSWIPEKVHNAITVTIKQMVKGVLFGAKYISSEPLQNTSLELREERVRKKINIFRKTAAVEGGITGAGGILLVQVDFPVLLGRLFKNRRPRKKLQGPGVWHRP